METDVLDTMFGFALTTCAIASRELYLILINSKRRYYSVKQDGELIAYFFVPEGCGFSLLAYGYARINSIGSVGGQNKCLLEEMDQADLNTVIAFEIDAPELLPKLVWFDSSDKTVYEFEIS